ncbi:adhesin HecA family repeat [compost metagenome]
MANQGGHLSARSGNALLSVASLDNSQGALFARQRLLVNGNNLTNAGQIAAGSVDFSLAGALNNEAGIIESDSILTLAAASLDNRGGQLRALGTGGRTQLTVQGLLDNRNGTLETANLEFGLAAGSLQNVGGTLLHAGSGPSTSPCPTSPMPAAALSPTAASPWPPTVGPTAPSSRPAA